VLDIQCSDLSSATLRDGADASHPVLELCVAKLPGILSEPDGARARTLTLTLTGTGLGFLGFRV
jgi:hypothetical protein